MVPNLAALSGEDTRAEAIDADRMHRHGMVAPRIRSS